VVEAETNFVVQADAVRPVLAVEQAAVLECLFGVEVVLAPAVIFTVAVEDVGGQQNVGFFVSEWGTVADVVGQGAALVIGEHVLRGGDGPAIRGARRSATGPASAGCAYAWSSAVVTRSSVHRSTAASSSAVSGMLVVASAVSTVSASVSRSGCAVSATGVGRGDAPARCGWIERLDEVSGVQIETAGEVDDGPGRERCQAGDVAGVQMVRVDSEQVAQFPQRQAGLFDALLEHLTIHAGRPTGVEVSRARRSRSSWRRTRARSFSRRSAERARRRAVLAGVSVQPSPYS
jgi:hypothetical protein